VFTPLIDGLIEDVARCRFQSITALKNGNNMRRRKDNENWQEQVWHKTAFATSDKLYP